MNDFDFMMGVFYSAGILVTLHDQPQYALDIISEAGYLDEDLSDLDDTEKEAMRELQKQYTNCNFTGL